ncbi:MAG: hypothetical protein AB7V43_20550 [Acidimicrobiia bacterium]
MGPQQVDSCVDCFAWGATRHNSWRCIACRAWHDQREFGTCRSCDRAALPLSGDGACRLCRKQRSLTIRVNELRSNLPDVVTTSSAFQQLFLADMFILDGPRANRRGKKPPAPPLPDAELPVGWRQEELFMWPADLRIGRRVGFPDPPNSQILETVLRRVDVHAARYGWSTGHTSQVRGAMRILLGRQETPGARLRATEIMPLGPLGYSVPAVIDVLTEINMFDDDREPAIVTWFRSQTIDLPDPIQHELGVWFDVMRHGSAIPPRRLPRKDATITSHLRTALPAVRHWSTTHDSLREINRDEVKRIIPTSGWQRGLMVQSLRSIFKILKARQLVFANPTTHMRVPHPDVTIPDPIDLTKLRAAIDAHDPARAAIAGLLAYHGVRGNDLRAALTTDIRDGRLHIGEHTVPLAEPVRDCVAAYLDYRNQTWPNTINPHLFINRRSATHTRAVNQNWFRDTLGMAPDAVRRDRILDEALATGGDLRQLTDMFNVHVATAYRYTQIADRAHAADRATQPATMPTDTR